MSGNSARAGGGIASYRGTTTLTNSTVSANSVSFFGGGILARYGAATLTNSTVSGNSTNVVTAAELPLGVGSDRLT